jgi:hypothetical protein
MPAQTGLLAGKSKRFWTRKKCRRCFFVPGDMFTEQNFVTTRATRLQLKSLADAAVRAR